MILKMLSRKSLASLNGSLLYVLKQGSNHGSNEAISAPWLHNLRSAPEDLDSIVEEIKETESYRKIIKGRNYYYHTIISLGVGDRNEILKDSTMMERIARKYFALRGNVVGFAVAHYAENPHIHCIESSTLYRKNATSSLSKANLLKLKIELSSYITQEFPALKHSLVRHGQSLNIARISESESRIQGRSDKDLLRAIVLDSFNKAQSKRHFLELLRGEHNLLHYERSNDGVPTGIVTESGRKYRFKRLAGIEPEQIMNLQTQQELKREQHLQNQVNKLRQNRMKGFKL